MAERLNGKIALVTGGAAGMGAAHARGIVAEGGKVLIGDLADEAGQQLADELGDSAIFVHMNVTESADWDNAVKVARDTFGGLNVLVNNAGIMGMGSIATYSEEDWDRVMAINVKGAFLGIKHSFEALKESQPASIINVSSVTGLQGVGGLAPYSTSKWALRGLTKSAALEFANKGIRVNTIFPGTIASPMNLVTPGADAEKSSLTRAADPAEITALVVYLASDESGFSSGADFVADGGVTAGSVMPGLD